MAKPQLYFSTQARADLAELEDYISERSGTLQAERIIARVVDVCEAIARMPGMGRDRPDLDGTPRVLPVRPWLIFYEPLSDGTGVLIQRVVDGRRDLAKLDRFHGGD